MTATATVAAKINMANDFFFMEKVYQNFDKKIPAEWRETAENPTLHPLQKACPRIFVRLRADSG